uniref:PX domain-containing protein n=1 Tax=Glossina brevipalpis TaxID=37001 RepID=A0A1A9WKD0_9MUSC
MHFSIPDTQELYAERTNTTYTAYNIYINGCFHACLRYKQLHALHEQLRRRCMEMGLELPTFPPKKLLPLTNNQVEVRRAALEHYLQSVGQDHRIAKFDLFQNFLLTAQLETATDILEEWFGYGNDSSEDQNEEDFMATVTLEVVLPNNYHMRIECRISDNATTLLKKTSEILYLPTKMVHCFCLFLVRKENNDALVLLRKLMDFESPFISRLRSQPCQIQIYKSYFNPVHDLYVMKEPVALNILYMQTVADVEREWIITTPEILKNLRILQKHGLKMEYIEMARQLPLYGCLQFLSAQVDYPEPQTTALIAIGNKELSMRTMKADKIYETKFRVTRMRCWRVTAVHNTQECKDRPYNLQLSFEYLMSKQSLRWITISSTQAMLMSVCLQAMVDELLNYKENEPLEAISNNANVDFICAQTPSSSSTTSSSTHTATEHNLANTSLLSSPSSSTTMSNYSSQIVSSSSSDSPTAPVKFLTQRVLNKQNPKLSQSHTYGAVFFRNSCPQSAQESVQNEAFDEIIGDDDL